MAWWQWFLIGMTAWFVVAVIAGLIIGPLLKRNTRNPD